MDFIRIMSLIVILTAVAVFSSEQPYLCLLVAGILMVIFAVENVLDEEQHMLINFCKMLLVAAFAVLSGHFSAFLLFYECRLGRREPVWWAAPFILCVTWELLKGDKSFPYIICDVMILGMVILALALAQRAFFQYFTVKQQVARTIEVTAINEMYEKKLNQELQLKHYLAEKNARLEERENISRNIHNSVGHSITAAIMTLEAADMLFEKEPERAKEKMNVANERIQGSLESIRHAVRVLDTEKDAVRGDDFIKELSDIAESFVMDTTITVKMDFAAFPTELQLPHEHTEFFTGAVQEMLTNGVRHGKADIFILRVTGDSRHIKVSVLDNGKSDFDEKNAKERIKNGFGIKKMSSYVQKCGGSIRFWNENGFVTELELPIFAEEQPGVPVEKGND